ncbi:hypothetical protein [Mucilaginibacter pedocola]|uniref:Uncharacterized protein n=1 Tax=Mucilaginibacter pedocola TaxID=1792845 RepID=A0A1S9PBH2_9SPHI|nr:hypothetical protein [Mucilaginibacter pedocola]OOQ58332.1 hypothetical protein BC343_11910 [Mucilaginibacter pedocola]
MVKASALYMAIIIALFIAVICSALIVVGYYYRLELSQKERFNDLRRNLGSGQNILLADSLGYAAERAIILFGHTNDSLRLQRYPWGIFDVGVVKAFIQSDTLVSAFQIGRRPDTLASPALYLVDEDRPLSVSGQTLIKGPAYLPKSGIRAAYVDNEGYKGDKKMVNGPVRDSERGLPVLNSARMALLKALFQREEEEESGRLQGDTLKQLFRAPQKLIYFGKVPQTLAHISLSGHILIVSDTTITVDSTAKLQNVIIAAKSLKIGAGFTGTCQLFAQDSLIIGDDVRFNYPSCIGLLADHSKGRQILQIGNKAVIEGIVFCPPAEDESLPPLMQFGKEAVLRGQVYAGGVLSFKGKMNITGGAYAKRFLYQNAYTAYENYLINISLDATSLSRYYLNGMLLPFSAPKTGVLQWLDK